MNLPEDVIVDLLPSYFADEASPATRAIVDDYFAAHPRFAQAMRAAHSLELPDPGVGDGGKEALRRVRRRLKSRSLLFALALFCSVTPFAFIFEDGVLRYLMWRDAPLTALCYASVGLIAWGALWFVDRADPLAR